MDAQDTSANGKEPQIHGTGPHLMGGFEPEEGWATTAPTGPSAIRCPRYCAHCFPIIWTPDMRRPPKPARTGPSRASRPAEWGWQAIAAIAIAVVFAAAVAQTTRIAPACSRRSRACWPASAVNSAIPGRWSPPATGSRPRSPARGAVSWKAMNRVRNS